MKLKLLPLLLIILTACTTPRPTVKIALVAPFEGRYRDTGYAVFPGFRETLQMQMKAGGVGAYQVEFVAYNDSGDPAYAERIAHNVVIDPQVMLVIGHLRADTTLAALPVYAEAGLPVLAMNVPSNIVASALPTASQSGLVFAGTATDDINAVTQRALNAIHQAAKQAKMSRQSVAKALANN